MTQNKGMSSKGQDMEELLRDYFLKAGYFVIRGVPFVYEGFDVTDIDIWLYSRTSSVSREVTIVDSKNKKTPQAIERIFWVQGLRIATKSTNAIVATTDRRQEVKDFGRDIGVAVLDGSFLSRLVQANAKGSDRISDEDFHKQIDDYNLNKLDGDWKKRIKKSKSLLATPLSFDSCNEWLSQGRFFAEQAATKENHKEIALRCLYLIISFVAIAIDYNMKELSFLEALERSRLLKDGFTYGSRGSSGIKKILNISDARKMKEIGRTVSNYNEDIWRFFRSEVVYHASKIKFTQNRELMQLLFSTKGTTLVEASPNDTIWGIGLPEENPSSLNRNTWKGKNLLGEILTHLRVELMGEY